MRLAQDRGSGDAAPSPEAAALRREEREALLGAIERLSEPRAAGRHVPLPARALGGGDGPSAGDPAGNREVEALARPRASCATSWRDPGMGDRRMTNEQVAAALTALGRRARVPRDPVAAERRHSPGSRPSARPGPARVLPRRALWSRRRVLVLATIGLLAALALAAAARFAIGAIEIRVQPGVTPSASLPPGGHPTRSAIRCRPEEAVALAGFEPSLPSGPAPDEVYVVDSPFGDPGLVLRVAAERHLPGLAGDRLGARADRVPGRRRDVVKSVQAFEDVHAASVGGVPAAWIPVPHVLELETERGFRDVLGPWQRPDLGGGRRHVPARDLARPGVGARDRSIDRLTPRAEPDRRPRCRAVRRPSERRHPWLAAARS